MNNPMKPTFPGTRALTDHTKRIAELENVIVKLIDVISNSYDINQHPKFTELVILQTKLVKGKKK